MNIYTRNILAQLFHTSVVQSLEQTLLPTMIVHFLRHVHPRIPGAFVCLRQPELRVFLCGSESVVAWDDIPKFPVEDRANTVRIQAQNVSGEWHVTDGNKHMCNNLGLFLGCQISVGMQGPSHQHSPMRRPQTLRIPHAITIVAMACCFGPCYDHLRNIEAGHICF